VGIWGVGVKPAMNRMANGAIVCCDCNHRLYPRFGVLEKDAHPIMGELAHLCRKFGYFWAWFRNAGFGVTVSVDFRGHQG